MSRPTADALTFRFSLKSCEIGCVTEACVINSGRLGLVTRVSTDGTGPIPGKLPKAPAGKSTPSVVIDCAPSASTENCGSRYDRAVAMARFAFATECDEALMSRLFWIAMVIASSSVRGCDGDCAEVVRVSCADAG